MRITEVRISLAESPDDKLKAYANIVFDGVFAVHNLRIIHGFNGLLVFMPARKLADRCPDCYVKNHLRARYCWACGIQLATMRAVRLPDGRLDLHADIAHPINNDFRKVIEDVVLKAYYEKRDSEEGIRWGETAQLPIREERNGDDLDDMESHCIYD